MKQVTITKENLSPAKKGPYQGITPEVYKTTSENMPPIHVVKVMKTDFWAVSYASTDVQGLLSKDEAFSIANEIHQKESDNIFKMREVVSEMGLVK